MHKVKHLDVKFYVFDDRLDDRLYLFQKKNLHTLSSLAKNVTLFTPRSFEVFDEMDKKERMYDPGIRNTSLKPMRVVAEKNGYYPYFPQAFNQGVCEAFRTIH